MVWNVQFQFAGLVLVLVVAGMCLAQRRLNYAAERAYIKLLFTVTLSIFFDILSIFAINYVDQIGRIACEVICKSYLITIVTVAFQSAFFSVTEIRRAISFKLKILFYIPLLIELVTFFIFPVNIYVGVGELYTYGVPVTLTYVL